MVEGSDGKGAARKFFGECMRWLSVLRRASECRYCDTQRRICGITHKEKDETYVV